MRRRRRRPRVEPLESRRLLTSTTVYEFPISPTEGSPGSIVAGPDGNLWFTEEVPDHIGIFNPSTGVISQVALPAGVAPQGITVGPDGNLWFTEAFGSNVNGQIAMINPTTMVVTPYPTLPNPSSYPTNIVLGPDGNLWFTETSVLGHDAQIGMINPKTGVISEFPLPNPNSQPYGITAGPDGNLWFTENNANAVGMINPTTHVIREFTVPTANAQPWLITTGADGNIWFTEYNKNNNINGWQLGMINPNTDAIQEVPLPNGGFQPRSITSGPDGNLWFTSLATSGSGAIWMFNPVTHGFSDWVVPTANSTPYGIASGPFGNLYFTQESTSVQTIGEVAPATQVMVASQPPPFVPPGASFGLTVTVNFASGVLDTGYNGQVLLALYNPGTATLGGTLTVNAQNGVATFGGLTINQLGSGYRLIAYTDLLTTTLTTPVTVDVAPTIVAEKVLYAGKGKHRHLVGFELDFRKPLATSPAQTMGNYTITQFAKRHGKSKPVTVTTAVYDATKNAVTLMLAGTPPFAAGGQIVVNAMPPLGLTDTLGEPLDGTGKGKPGVNATLLIAPKARRITLAS